MNIAVIGAGVVGLSTAVAIQERLSSPIEYSSITVIADRFDRHTTSFGAGGQVVPICPPGIPKHIGKKWCDVSAEHFYRLAFSSEASECGVNLVSGFHLTDNDHAPQVIVEKCLNVRQMDKNDLKRFGVTFKNGYAATSTIVELPIYLEWLMKKYVSDGGKVVQKHVKSLEELSGQFDVVVNCTGMGSRTLVNDPLMRPVRGQTLHVKAPWIKEFVRVDTTMHIFPFRDSVYVGSVKQEGNYDMNISTADSEKMLKRAQEVFPALKGARVLWEWVGLRPVRDSIRVEKETITTKQGTQLRVVHNYGHGSFGIALSRGTALDAAELVEGVLKERRHPAKL